jgi:hypothetical protein
VNRTVSSRRAAARQIVDPDDADRAWSRSPDPWPAAGSRLLAKQARDDRNRLRIRPGADVECQAQRLPQCGVVEPDPMPSPAGRSSVLTANAARCPRIVIVPARLKAPAGPLIRPIPGMRTDSAVLGETCTVTTSPVGCTVAYGPGQGRAVPPPSARLAHPAAPPIMTIAKAAAAARGRPFGGQLVVKPNSPTRLPSERTVRASPSVVRRPRWHTGLPHRIRFPRRGRAGGGATADITGHSRARGQGGDTGVYYEAPGCGSGGMTAGVDHWPQAGAFRGVT